MTDAEINRSAKKDAAILAFPESLYRKRFDSKSKLDNSGCRIWTGSIDVQGYGAFYIPDGTGGYFRARAHRVAWIRKHGAIPDGLVPDHLCRVRCCINDQHLELVTNQVNILRGTSPSALHAMKGTCPVGHPYSETNTGLIKTGGRRCRSCDRIRKKNKYWSERGIAS